MKTLVIFTATIAATIYITEKINEVKRVIINLKSDTNKIDLINFKLIDLQQKVNNSNISLEKLAYDVSENTQKINEKVEKEATRVILTPLTVHFPHQNK